MWNQKSFYPCGYLFVQRQPGSAHPSYRYPYPQSEVRPEAPQIFRRRRSFLFIPTVEASSGEWPTVLTERASCLVSGNSLKDARERREDAKRLLCRGIDPSGHKRQMRQARATAERDSFQNIAREWHETRMTVSVIYKKQGTDSSTAQAGSRKV